jgi:outer membrane protein assembly factor BamA
MRYYWYPKERAQFFSLASYALETDRRLTLRYVDPQLFSDRVYFKFDANIQHDGTNRFFGFGNNSQLGAEANYTLRDHRIEIFTGVNFWEKFRFVLGHRFRFSDVVDGPIGSLPKISRFNPLPAGVDGPKTILTQKAVLSYDSRDFVMAPLRGHYFQFYIEQTGRIGGDVRYERLGADLRGLYPLRNAQFVTAWHVLAEGMNGNDTVPLYEREWLGGKDSLRGFGEGRFIDNHKIVLSLEERIRFYTLKAFNVNVDFEVAPFYEAGAVYRERDHFRPADLHSVWGVGLRSIVRPNVVGDIELGFNEQGLALFVGIDYPF